MFDQEELEEARADKLLLLVQIGAVLRFVGPGGEIGGIPDGQGGKIGEYADVDQFPCLVSRPRHSGQFDEGDRDSPVADVIIEFAWDSDVTPADTVEVDGVQYEVLGTDKGKPNPIELIAFGVKKE